MSAVIVGLGLKEAFDYFERLPDLANEAAYLAINDVSRGEEVAIRRDAESQINFPKGYLSRERFGIRVRATRQSQRAVISGRDRPTSLARFAAGATVENSRGRPIFVKVSAGRSKRLDRAFIIKLRNGNAGLAIRLPAGEEPDKAYAPVELTRKGGKGQSVWLLYGPSVDQVVKSIYPQRAPKIADALQEAFFRQFSRLSNRG